MAAPVQPSDPEWGLGGDGLPVWPPADEPWTDEPWTDEPWDDGSLDDDGFSRDAESPPTRAELEVMFPEWFRTPAPAPDDARPR
jgi:hypothetical protein